MSNNNSWEDPQMPWNEEKEPHRGRELVFRNTVYEPLHWIINTCRLLLVGEWGRLSEEQSDAVTQMLKCAEFVMKETELHLKVQGIVVGRLPDAHENDT